jgi:CRISPR-associated endonuclease Csn1
MSKNILGIDLGTNSIGLAIRDIDGQSLNEQLVYFSSVIFPSGVGKGKTGEFSYAAERTKHRSSRNLRKSRRYRIWSTLKLLIENGYCPLTMEDLEKWSRYDKAKGLKRQYPIHATQFEQWVRLDFDGDGKADYSSPFELRAELMERQFDFTNQIEKYKLGRALYHIAQRRGFKSSKGETIKEQEENESFEDFDISDELKKSEVKKSGELEKYMDAHNLPTVGCAFAHLEKNGIRVRNSKYQAVRSQYKKEIEKIFKFQSGLDKDGDFYRRLVSEKKGEGTIFYKNPLRSQKGQVGTCTLEPSKSRCPISHPDFENFRAWCLINNIKFGEGMKETLTIEQKNKLFKERFLLTRSSFKFQDIREWIQKEIGRNLDYRAKTINYKDKTNVSGCPISGRLKNLLGDDWENWTYQSNEEKTNKKTGEVRRITYDVYDLWHVCFSFDEPEYVEDFAKNKLLFDDEKTKQLVRIFGAIQQGYGMLSLKAIRNINRFLHEGLIYTDAVLLAKLPDIFKDKWEGAKEEVVSQIDTIINKNRELKQLYNIANALIANYKSLGYDEETQTHERFADHDFEYKLQDSDLRDVEKAVIGAIGEKSWEKKNEEEQQQIINNVAQLYQEFFASEKRDYYKLPKVSDALADFLREKFTFLSEKDLKQLYHPSMIEFYAPAKEQKLDDGRWMKLLGSPVIGALKNPMAMRVLHTLRKQVNALLKDSLIDEETRIVVETAKELNDANMRWAIEAYQREREAENKEYEKLIGEFHPNREIKEEDIEQVRILCEQHDIPEKGKSIEKKEKTKEKESKKVPIYKKDITKYRLWLEQGCRCIYTGKIINITNLFDENAFDIEHTIPRSVSFDDSLANLTVCDAHFNRTVKKNQIPTQLANYEEIKLRLQPWFEKVEQLKDNVAFWKSQSKKAQTKERKDQCIRQRHLWQMELNYWSNKVERFTMTEVTSGFRNSQLNDTRIITKYAYHYLKTVFNKVDVQKGSVTANFRKMLGIQSIDEKKSRDKHSHHAIDATVLTLIPTAAQRDKMLELFYKIQEEEWLGHNTSILRKELEKERKKCGLTANISNIVPFIEENILVNHISKDQTLTPSRKRKRIRGKIVPKRDNNGNVLYELNEDGTFKLDKFGDKIPQAKEWITGDSIRGQLHGETFYGAITQGQKDEKGTLLRNEDGSIATDGNVRYVVRRILKYKSSNVDSGFKNWDDLKEVIVDKDLFSIMIGQFPEGTSFKVACERGIYMFKKNKDGKIDYSDDCKVNKIRHIRCFTSVKNPLEIKQQTYLSDKPYKQNYYAEMGDLYVMCKYEDIDKTEKEYRIYSLFDISENRKIDIEDIPFCIDNKKKNKTLLLSHQLKRGDMLLLYTDSIDELKEMDNEILSQRLYVIRGFENPSLIKLVKHSNAQPEKDLGKGESIKDYGKIPEKIRCGINTLKYLIHGVDFWMTPKGLVFKN